MPFEGSECVKELDFTALLLTQLRKYPSQLNMLKISKNLVTIISATNSNFRMKNSRSSHSQVFNDSGALENYAKFTRKHLC